MAEYQRFLSQVYLEGRHKNVCLNLVYRLLGFRTLGEAVLAIETMGTKPTFVKVKRGERSLGTYWIPRAICTSYIFSARSTAYEMFIDTMRNWARPPKYVASSSSSCGDPGGWGTWRSWGISEKSGRKGLPIILEGPYEEVSGGGSNDDGADYEYVDLKRQELWNDADLDVLILGAVSELLF